MIVEIIEHDYNDRKGTCDMRSICRRKNESDESVIERIKLSLAQGWTHLLLESSLSHLPACLDEIRENAPKRYDNVTINIISE